MMAHKAKAYWHQFLNSSQL